MTPDQKIELAKKLTNIGWDTLEEYASNYSYVVPLIEELAARDLEIDELRGHVRSLTADLADDRRQNADRLRKEADARADLEARLAVLEAGNAGPKESSALLSVDDVVRLRDSFK